METILIIAITGTLNLACFFIGAKLGQMVQKGETIPTPEVNPMKLYKERQERQEVDMEKQKLDIVLRNIERYDGTGNGQEDVPR